jgi:DNA gyrase subunit A
VLKRDAVAKVVLNNLYKHTQLQYTFGCNMLAIVDGVPRTLRLDEFVRYYVAHQVDVIVRRTRFQLRRAEERAHILRALAKALDRMDDVIALIRGSASAEAARSELMALLDIDEVQAVAILDMQLRRLAALERQRIMDELAEREREIAELQAILADPARQRAIIGEELGEIVERYGDERRTRVVAHEGDMSAEDFIAQEDVVVTVTRGGYAKRTQTDLYRSQRRGGRGVQGASLKQDDIVERFFVTTTHHWLLFFTDQGRSTAARPRAARGQPQRPRPARRQHPRLPARRADRAGHRPARLRRGAVPRARHPQGPGEEDSADGVRQRALQRPDRHQPARGRLAHRRGPHQPRRRPAARQPQAQSIRFHASDDALRPMGRPTSGVIGMKLTTTTSCSRCRWRRPVATRRRPPCSSCPTAASASARRSRSTAARAGPATAS